MFLYLFDLHLMLRHPSEIRQSAVLSVIPAKAGIRFFSVFMDTDFRQYDGITSVTCISRDGFVKKPDF